MKILGGEQFLNIKQLLVDIGVTQGMRLADFGCGVGYVAIPAALLVGKGGVVYAIDVQASVLEQLTGEARALGLAQIRPLRANLEKSGSTRLEANSLDMVLVVNLLFMTTQKDAMLAEAQRITKPGGKIIVIDWRQASTPVGPQPDQRVDFSRVDLIADQLRLVKIDTFQAGQYHYGVIYRK